MYIDWVLDLAHHQHEFKGSIANEFTKLAGNLAEVCEYTMGIPPPMLKKY